MFYLLAVFLSRASPLQLRAYPNSPQQANVVSQQFLKDEEVAGCLLLMQLLHLVL